MSNNYEVRGVVYCGIKYTEYEEGSDMWEVHDITARFDSEWFPQKSVMRYVSGTYALQYDGKTVMFTDLCEVAMRWLQIENNTMDGLVTDILMKA